MVLLSNTKSLINNDVVSDGVELTMSRNFYSFVSDSLYFTE